MSVIFVVAPVVAGSWPVIAAVIVAASTALGYVALTNLERAAAGVDPLLERSVDMRMEDSSVVTDALMRGESFMVQREGLRAEFRVDGRGQCQVHVSGIGLSDEQLQAAGQELMDRVRQQFAYAQVMSELESRGFQVVGQDLEQDQSIRIRVRR